jgi:hypothetical protein
MSRPLRETVELPDGAERQSGDERVEDDRRREEERREHERDRDRRGELALHGTRGAVSREPSAVSRVVHDVATVATSRVLDPRWLVAVC